MSWWFSKKNQPKSPSQNNRVQIDLSKMTLWSSWTWEQNHRGGVLLTKIPGKKTMIYCSESKIPCSHNLSTYQIYVIMNIYYAMVLLVY